VALAAVLAVAIAGLTGCGGSSSQSTNAASAGTAAVRPAGPVLKPAGMATIAESALPPEAREVLRRIDAGGPFQHRQDGVTFQNRERLLPKQSGGYYREYTVDTPGAQDRGARRLILGRQGELYYTADHYRSFLWVVRGGSA
jgi:ribonuclease T1